MSNWKLINKTYLYDGTFDGLLTIIFNCYCAKCFPQKILPESDYIENFLDNITLVKTDYSKSKEYLMELKIIFHIKLYITAIMPFYQIIPKKK